MLLFDDIMKVIDILVIVLLNGNPYVNILIYDISCKTSMGGVQNRSVLGLIK